MFPSMSEPLNTDYAARAAGLTEASRGLFPDHVGLEVIELGSGYSRMKCAVRQHHLAPNGYLHAGVMVALADTAAGFGCVANLPEGSTGFTTIELKTNFLGTLLEGTLLAEGKMAHGGRTTQIWDVEVTDEAGDRTLAIFRCTQLILYPRS